MQALKMLMARVHDGYTSEGRNGATTARYGEQLQVDLKYGFPLCTLRQLSFDVIVQECLWYIRGDTHIHELNARGVHIWDQWADDAGNLGPVYGAQMRNWDGIGLDQLEILERALATRDQSRRLLVLFWNPRQLPEMALPPCPFAFQLHLFKAPGPCISMTVYQRSADVMIGVPHDIAVFALLLSMFGWIHGFQPRLLTFQFGDAHIYEAHTDGYNELMSRKPVPPKPAVDWRYQPGTQSIAQINDKDIQLRGYTPHPAFKMKVIV